MLLVDYLIVVLAHVEEKRKELVKYVHRLARLKVHLMSISDSGVTVQNGAESSPVVEVKEKQESDLISLVLNGAFNNQRVEVSPKGEMVYFATKVYCVFLMWES